MAFTADFENNNFKNIVVFGGTGAQGASVVRALSDCRHYSISVLTRDVNKLAAVELKEKHNVALIQGSYTSESGLRAAFKGQDVCYYNGDSFSIPEPDEYFWTFRAYEIAVQSGLKWFIYSGAIDRFAKFGYDEKYRNSHNIVSSRLSGWLSSQPLERLPWTIVHGGVYTAMLKSLLRPVVNEDRTITFKAPMNEDSIIPLVPLEMYGRRVLWALQNPAASIGRVLSCAAYHVTFPEIAQAVQNICSQPTFFQGISAETWMEEVHTRFGIDPDVNLPRKAANVSDDPARFTFRKSFTAFWALWQDNRGQFQDKIDSDSWADSMDAARPKTLQEWMIRSDYVGAIGLTQ